MCSYIFSSLSHSIQYICEVLYVIRVDMGQNDITAVIRSAYLFEPELTDLSK